MSDVKWIEGDEIKRSVSVVKVLAVGSEMMAIQHSSGNYSVWAVNEPAELLSRHGFRVGQRVACQGMEGVWSISCLAPLRIDSGTTWSAAITFKMLTPYVPPKWEACSRSGNSDTEDIYCAGCWRGSLPKPHGREFTAWINSREEQDNGKNRNK